MTSYIARRLLLMIPTLIGITFLVFMLIAASPGGIGETESGPQEGQEAGAGQAARQAYLEDRYGLGDPLLVQYFRWLRGVSPVKFGTQALVDPTGRTVHSPKELSPPELFGEWYGEGMTLTEQRAGDASEVEYEAEAGEALAAEKERRFRRAEDAYSRVRADFVQARTRFELAVAEYARGKEEAAESRAAELRREAALARRAADGEETEETRALSEEIDELEEEAEYWGGMLNNKDQPRWGRLAEVEPDVSTPEGAAAVAAGVAAAEEFNEAVAVRNDLADVFMTTPFPRAGFGIQDTVTVALPELGFSYARSRPVVDLILEALPRTLLLNAIAVPIIYLIAVPAGMLMAVRRGTLVDVGLGATVVALWSVPIVWTGVLLVGFLASDEYLGWFPTGGLQSTGADEFLLWPTTDPATGVWQRGYILDVLWHVTLPVVCLVYAGFAIISKQTRAAMLDNFNADYVRTAKAKGVKYSDVVFRHVFRNSLLPLITMFATIFPAMLAGSVVVERIFSIPGMGSLILEAIALRDRELLLANTLMVGVVNLLALLLADILYALADPRISYD